MFSVLLSGEVDAPFLFLFSFFLYSTESSQELIDAELAARVLQLINVTDSGLHSQVPLNVPENTTNVSLE